jgi:hypothetical protein
MLGSFSIWTRLFIWIFSWALGFWFLIKTGQVVYLIGEQPWAERRFGPTGTYTLVKLVGIFAILFGVVMLFQG